MTLYLWKHLFHTLHSAIVASDELIADSKAISEGKEQILSFLNEQVSSVKWGHLACNGVGLFQIFNHVKTIKNH